MRQVRAIGKLLGATMNPSEPDQQGPPERPGPGLNDQTWIPELPDALDAFHTALDNYPDYPIGHGRDPGWVDDCDVAVVEALLTAGWTTPPPPKGGLMANSDD
jgi:hypothetical protein